MKTDCGQECLKLLKTRGNAANCGSSYTSPCFKVPPLECYHLMNMNYFAKYSPTYLQLYSHNLAE